MWHKISFPLKVKGPNKVRVPKFVGTPLLRGHSFCCDSLTSRSNLTAPKPYFSQMASKEKRGQPKRFARISFSLPFIKTMSYLLLRVFKYSGSKGKKLILFIYIFPKLISQISCVLTKCPLPRGKGGAFGTKRGNYFINFLMLTLILKPLLSRTAKVRHLK